MIKKVLIFLYFLLFFSLLTKNAGIFLVIKPDDNLNKFGSNFILYLHNYTKKEEGNNTTNQLYLAETVRKYIGINSAYAYFSPNVPEFFRVRFNSDCENFSLPIEDYLNSLEGKVKLGTCSIFLGNRGFKPIHKEVISSLAITVFEENPEILNLKCNIDIIPFTSTLDSMVLRENLTHENVASISFERSK